MSTKDLLKELLFFESSAEHVMHAAYWSIINSIVAKQKDRLLVNTVQSLETNIFGEQIRKITIGFS